MTATWCPVHGDCTCERSESLDWSGCSLHGARSTHAADAPATNVTDNLGTWRRMPETDAPATTGDECECGHVRDEHNSGGCTVDDCPCFHYDDAPATKDGQ